MHDSLLRSDEIASLESQLGVLIHETRQRLCTPGAVAHLHHGFGVRHYVMQHCTQWLEAECAKSAATPLSSVTATEAALHLNGYYLTLRGALDNLAWMLQLELNLLPGITEASRERTVIHLFGKKYLACLRAIDVDLHGILAANAAWGQDLTNLRDPAAHRIPLYIPPGVFTSAAQLDQFRHLDALSGAPEHQLGGRRRIEIILEARAIATYEPVFCVTGASGIEKVYRIADQVSSDHRAYLQLSLAVLSHLVRDASRITQSVAPTRRARE